MRYLAALDMTGTLCKQYFLHSFLRGGNAGMLGNAKEKCKANGLRETGI